MSVTRHYFIHCDYRGCNGYVMGDAGQAPSAMRKSKKVMGDWVSRKEAPGPWHIKYGIEPKAMEDFCPSHHPVDEEAK